MYDIFSTATGRFGTFKAVFSAMLLAIYLFGIAASGGSIFELALFIGCVLIYVFLPGFSVSALLVHDEERNVCVSLALGSALLCISHILYLVSGLKLILMVLPLIPMAIYVTAKIRNKEKDPSLVHVLDSNLILVYACIVFMFTFIVAVKHAHPAMVGEITLSQDFMWTVGNAESLKMSFPPMDIRYRGVTLKYHYLTELIAAAVSSVTGISCYNILAFYMQSFMAAVLERAGVAGLSSRVSC